MLFSTESLNCFANCLKIPLMSPWWCNPSHFNAIQLELNIKTWISTFWAAFQNETIARHVHDNPNQKGFKLKKQAHRPDCRPLLDRSTNGIHATHSVRLHESVNPVSLLMPISVSQARSYVCRCSKEKTIGFFTVIFW